MKFFQTKKKLVYLLILFIIIFAVAIVTSIILIQNEDNENKQATNTLSVAKTIRKKIRNNYLVLNKDVDTSSQEKLLQVVKKQLKKQNPQLTVADLAKITLPANFTPILGVKNKVNLKITVSFPNESSEIIQKEIFLKKQRELLANSNIRNGGFGFIFQDDQGNLWAMANGTKLQVLKKGATSWTDDVTQGLTKDSNITNGYGGFIFQDRQGNLWALGHGTKLQVLKKAGEGYADSWTDDLTKGLTKGSKITYGYGGFIFQDRQGNLWAMSDGINDDLKLQVLKKAGAGYVDSWTDDQSQSLTSLTKGYKITHGKSGFIFQDDQGNLWALGYRTKLQVLKKGVIFWTDDVTKKPLFKGSEIRNGWSGFIFEDTQGNLWALGYETKLQVLKKGTTSWTDDQTKESLLKGSKITDGRLGFIFQDRQGNLWAMGNWKKLQVLKKTLTGYASSWTDDVNQGLTKGSKIRDGYAGFIFQDRQGNLWALGNRTKLQVLREGSDSWES